MTYEGEGSNKKEAKARCALNALDALKASGRYAERMAEVKIDRFKIMTPFL